MANFHPKNLSLPQKMTQKVCKGWKMAKIAENANIATFTAQKSPKHQIHKNSRTQMKKMPKIVPFFRV